MDDGDVTGVINHVLEVTKDDRPSKRVAALNAIRTKILRSNEYKHPQFDAKIQSMMRRDTVTSRDKERLTELLRSPLCAIRGIQMHRGTLFDSRELHDEIRRLSSVVDPFYEFVVPKELQDAARRDRQLQVRENHRHHHKPAQEYHFTTTEIKEMRTTACMWIESEQDWSRRVNSMRLLEALGLLTGRRKWELCQTLKIRSVPGQIYQAEVRGIGKKIFDLEWRRIPLLAPLQLIVQGLTKARRYAHTQGDYGCAKKLFPRLTHTRYRDLYATLAFEERSLNQFHVESCSELWWKSQALCNDLLTYTKHYATLVIDRDASRQPVEPVEQLTPAVADSLGESRIDVPEDTV